MSRWGARGKSSKLTEDKVRAIKRALFDGASAKTLAEEYGVAKSTISQIRHGTTWAYVKVPCEEANKERPE